MNGTGLVEFYRIIDEVNLVLLFLGMMKCFCTSIESVNT